MLNSISHAFRNISHHAACTSKRSEATQYSTQTPEGWWDLISTIQRTSTIINAQSVRSRRRTNHWGSLFVFWISVYKVKNCTPLFNLQSPEMSRACSKTTSTEPQQLPYSPTHLKGGAKRHLNSPKKNPDSPSLHPCRMPLSSADTSEMDRWRKPSPAVILS